MKIIHKPTVYLVGRQTVNDAEVDRFLHDHGVTWETDTFVAAEELVEIAGRVCYMSFAKPRPGGNAAYTSHIMEVGHGSVLEHAVWNLLITGVSRSLTHELVRHRAGFGYSQLSQRYVDESVAEYVEPDMIADNFTLHNVWMEAIERAHGAYMVLVGMLEAQIASNPIYEAMSTTDKRKLARQSARSVLPNATETKIFVTANARAFRHFIELRCNRHAEPEIRKLAMAILDFLEKESPNLFGDYVKIDLPDGTYEASTGNRKV